jgi:hypothetical protein
MSLECLAANVQNSGNKTNELIYDFNRALQAKALELERQRATDSLKKGLERRPDKEELIERMLQCYLPNEAQDYTKSIIGNILPDSTAAPALQGHQRELQKHMRADSLEQKLQSRPKPEDLVGKGILEPSENHTEN